MTDVATSTQPALPSRKPPVVRHTIIAGYIISLEDGAQWANKIWKNPSSPLPADLETSPTVLGLINKDFKKQGGLAVHFNIVDIRNPRDIVTTQTIHGTWLNDWQETDGRELVRDPNLQLKEGDADRVISAHLKQRGIEPIEFGCYYF